MGIFKELGFSASKSSSSSSQSTQKVLSQEAIDKLIYDVMSSDQGLSALATGENASGGYNSTTKSLMAQDLITKLTGEIANITAPTIVTNNSKESKKGLGGKTVICTELMRQGLLDEHLYAQGKDHFLRLHPYTVRGYQCWAISCVPVLAKHPRLAKFIAPVAVKRYEYIVRKEYSIIGMSTVYIAQPICFLIGALLQLIRPETKEQQIGRFA